MAAIQLKSKAVKGTGSKQMTSVLTLQGVDYTLDLDDGSVAGFTPGPNIPFKITPKLPRNVYDDFYCAMLAWKIKTRDASGVVPSSFNLNI